MSKFKNWQMLNEAFGKMLGVSSPAVSFASSMPPSDQDPSMDDSMPSDDMDNNMDDDMEDDDEDSDSSTTTHVCPNCGFEIEIEDTCSSDDEDELDSDDDDDDDMSSEMPEDEPPYVQEESVAPADDTEFLGELRKEFAGCFTKSSITEDMLIDPKDDPAFFANLPSQSDYEPLNLDDLNLPKVGEEPDVEGLGLFSIFGL